MTQPSDVIANRFWLRRTQPWPHIVARDVFKPEFYQALERQIRTLLAVGLSETPAPGRFSRNLPGYDAYGLGLDQADGQPAAIFLSAAWRDILSRLYGIGPTPYVFAGAHHHTPGSASGFIHNDFNPVWFPRASDGRIQTPQQDLCSYKTGSGLLAPTEKIEVARGAVVIFFLANEDWRPGDGGETGLYASGLGQVGEPDAVWPPKNNTLVSFECTPQSFHGYLANTRIARTSIIMWVHRALEEAVALFGVKQLERWKS